MELNYYQCDGPLVVFCGPLGCEGCFIIFVERADRRWEFCPPGSARWDRCHQAAFNTHQATLATPGDYLALPPLPATWPWPPPAELTLYDPPARASEHALPEAPLARLVERGGGSLPVYVVLTEDSWESQFGDGCYRDFKAAFFDEASARELMTQSQAGLDAHLRRGVLLTTTQGLRLEMTESTPFDHCEAADVLDALAAKLDSHD